MARDGSPSYHRAMTTARQMPTLLHRASELANSGAYSDWTGVAGRLQEEGFEDAEAVLREQSLRVQIDLVARLS